MDAIERIRAERVVAVLRRVPALDDVVAELAAAGVGVLEVTLDDPGALAAIERFRGRGDVAVVAGTVRTAEQAAAAAAAGAEALVSPVLTPAVVSRAGELGVPVIPGALTPTEIETAWRFGAAMVKLFPARLGGPRYVADIAKPLTDVPLVCTGGVTASNAAEYLAAGAAAVGVSFRDPTEAGASAAALLGAVATA